MESRSEKVCWREKRQAVHSQHRLLATEDTTEDLILDKQQVEEVAKCLAGRKEGRMKLLRQLTYTFGLRPDLIMYFIKINTSMPTLMSLLTGSNAEMQAEVLPCLINMAAGSDDDVHVICRTAAPYLVTYLGGSNHILQDLCAWCIGNLAANSDVRSSHLVSLGVLHLLVQLLKSSSPGTAQSASSTLVIFAKTSKFLDVMMSEGVLPALESHLVADEDNYETLAEVAWLVFYISARSEYLTQIKVTHVPEKVAVCFVDVTRKNIHKCQVLTPVLRSLGNMCCDLDIASRVIQCNDLMPLIGQVMTSAPDLHLRKESLWLLTNLAVSPEGCTMLVSSGLLRYIAHSLASTDHIKIQACQCLCNILSQSCRYQDAEYTESVIRSIVPLLNHPDTTVVMATLTLTELLITNQQHLSTFESCQGRVALETLLLRPTHDVNVYHDGDSDSNRDDKLSAMAKDLLNIFYSA